MVIIILYLLYLVNILFLLIFKENLNIFELNMLDCMINYH